MVDYSPTEERLLEIMLKQKKGAVIDTVALHDLFYADGKERPWYSQNSVMSAMRSLIAKTEANKEPFRIERSERRGPKAVEFWLAKKK